MPFADYDSMEDCISQNQGKVSNPGAYCATIHHQATGKWPSQKEAYRHPDFQKIYKQFIAYEDGENRYFNWITALNLDETKSYAASRREQFKWLQKHADFEFWKEDKSAKYWRVEAGFPLESMNANVYSKDELFRSARTIKGQTVNLNHKYTLPTIEVLAGEYEDGIVECVLRVPKELHCPICDKTKTINDLIESKGIVNVSLEASCMYGSTSQGKCEGMYFTGLSLLTKDILPGIPLTRIMPLESIMVEALQVNETNVKTTGGRKMRKVKMVVTEAKEAEYPWDKCVSDRKADGYTDEQAQRICAAIKNRTITHSKLFYGLKDKEAYDLVLKKCKEDKLFAYNIDNFIEQQDIKPGSHYCETHPDDPRCKEHQKAIHGEQATEPPADCGEGKIWDPKQGKCVPTGETGQTEQATTPPNLTKPLSTGQRDIGVGAYEPDENGQCKPGDILNHALGKCVPGESCPKGQHFNQQSQRCEPDTPPKPETPETATGTSPAPAEQLVTVDTTPGEAPYERPMPVPEPTPPSPSGTKLSQMPPEAGAGEEPGQLTPSSMPPLQSPEPSKMKPKPEHACVDGQHYDPTVNQCVPDEELTEMVRRIKAEAALVNSEKGRKAFEQFYIDRVTELRKHDTRLLESYNVMRTYGQNMRSLYEKAVSNLSIAQHEAKTWKEKRDELSGNLRDIERNYEKLRVNYENLQSKYHTALATNLELSEKQTKSNEDWLKLNTENENLKEAFKRKDILLKKAKNVTVKVM